MTEKDVGARLWDEGWRESLWWVREDVPGARRRWYCRLDRYSSDGEDIIRTVESGACRTASEAEDKAIARALRSPA